MRIKKGFKLRTVMGQNVIVGEGDAQFNFNKIISLNESAAVLWKAVEGKDFEPSTLADALMAEYEVDRATALADATAIATQWQKNGLVE